MITAVFSLLAVVFGYLVYPVNGTNDAIAFMPPSINFALHHELTNPVTKKFTDDSDPSGKERVLFYPPLFPMIVSLFISPQLPLSYPRQAFLALGIMNMLSLVLTSLIFHKIATLYNKKLSWFAVAFIFLASIITLRASWGSGGRPETLARLFIATGVFAVLYMTASRSKNRVLEATTQEKTLASTSSFPQKWINGHTVLMGILGSLLGLMAATHPGGTLLFAAAIGIFFSLEEGWRGALRDTALTSALGILVFLLLIQLSPFNVFEVISGVALNAGVRTQVFTGLWSGTHLMQVLAYDFSSPYKILLFLMMTTMLVFGIKVYREHRSKIKSPFLFLFFCAVFAGLMAYFVTEGRNGYVTIFFTPMLAALLYSAIHIFNTRMVQYGTAALLLLLAAVAARPIALFPFFIKDGVGIDAARAAFEKISSEHPSAEYLITFHMWGLSENYRATKNMSEYGPSDLPPHAMLIWGQTQDDYNAVTPPSNLWGCPIIQNNFVTKVPEVFGIRIAAATPSYAFAAYECP